jgi:hypothetical protein
MYSEVGRLQLFLIHTLELLLIERRRMTTGNLPSNADVFWLTLPADEGPILLQLELGRVVVDAGGSAGERATGSTR